MPASRFTSPYAITEAFPLIVTWLSGRTSTVGWPSVAVPAPYVLVAISWSRLPLPSAASVMRPELTRFAPVPTVTCASSAPCAPLANMRAYTAAPEIAPPVVKASWS